MPLAIVVVAVAAVATVMAVMSSATTTIGSMMTMLLEALQERLGDVGLQVGLQQTREVVAVQMHTLHSVASSSAGPRAKTERASGTESPLLPQAATVLAKARMGWRHWHVVMGIWPHVNYNAAEVSGSSGSSRGSRSSGSRGRIARCERR